jgi:putative nucleotidyltransferase-like protein
MDLGPEFRLFCLALRQPPTPDDLQKMRRLAAGVRQWNVIVRGARRHRVASLVLAGLQACDAPDLPPEVLAGVRRLSVARAQGSLAHVAEVGRLCRLFAAAGVRVLVLKGVALSAQLYGEPGRRDARDIDLLVDPDLVGQAQTVLAQAGYTQRQNLPSPRRQAAYFRWVKDIQFVHDVTGRLVELHCRLTDNPNLLPSDFTALWNEREELRLGDGAIATLARHRLPLYLCLHGGDHGWARLRWLVDFAAALPRSQDMNAAVAAADACGLRWSFLHALLLAHAWLGLPVEDRLLAVCRNSAQIRRREWLIGRLYSPTDWYGPAPKGSWKRLLRYSLWERLYRFSLKSDWRYRTSQLQREWFSAADRDAVPLPEALSWLYPLVRPWGWLVRRLSLF